MSLSVQQRREVGQRLRQLRRSRGWSQEEAGRATDMGRPQFSRYELGGMGVSEAKVREIAVLLRVDPDWLLHGRGESPPELIGLSERSDSYRAPLRSQTETARLRVPLPLARPARTLLPVLTTAWCGREGVTPESLDQLTLANWDGRTVETSLTGPGLIAVEAEGESMGVAVEPGDIGIFDLLAPISAALGRVALIIGRGKDDSDLVVIKVVASLADPIILRSAAPGFPDIKIPVTRLKHIAPLRELHKRGINQTRERRG